MHNKRYLVLITIILLLVFVLSLTLFACKKNTSNNETDSGDISGDIDSGDTDSGDIDDTPEIPAYAKNARKTLEYLAASAQGDYTSIILTGGVELNSKKYVLDARANISEDDLEMAVKIKEESTGNIAIAVYVVDSKLYIQLPDGSIYHISDIDADYMYSILNKLPAELQEIINNALAGVGNGSLKIDTIINLIIPMLFKADYEQYSATGEGANKVENFVLTFTPDKFLKGLDGLINTLSGMLNINIDLSFINDIVAIIPALEGEIKASVKGGVFGGASFNIYSIEEGENYGNSLIGFSSDIQFGNDKVQIDIPENIKDYKEFSLTNINADFTLKIDTGDSGLDLGALIDSFLTQPIFGEGILVLKAGVDYKLQAKINLDANLEGKAEDNNLISLTLSAGDKVFAKVNYYEGTFYINVEDQIKIAVKYDLAAQINNLVDIITKAIDGALGTEFKSNADSSIASISLTESGDAIISSDITTIINKLLTLAGFNEYIAVNGNDIQLKVNQGLIDKITELAKVESIKFPYQIDLLVQLANNGIDYVEISMLDKTIVFKAENFLIGTSDLTKENVLASIGNIDEYGSDALSIVNSLLSDFSAKVKLDLSTIDTTVNLTNLINNVLAVSGQSLNLPLSLDFSNYNGLFTLNFAIHQGATSLDNRLLLELITPEGDVLISAYIYDGKTYVDLSNLGFMKFSIINVDLFDYVRSLLTSGVSTASSVDSSAVSSDTSIALTSQLNGELVIDLDNTSISAVIKSEFLLALMRSLMFDAGVDVDVNANIDMSGVMNAILDAGFMAVELNIIAGKESDDPINISGINKLEYTEVDALNAEALVEGIVNAQNFNLMLDIYNNNCDTEFNKETRIVLRKANASQGSYETLSNGLQAPYNSMVLGIYDNWNNLDNGNVLIWGVLDINGGKVHIKGTSKWFDYFVADGTAVDIPIDMDIKGMLVGMLSGLFGESTGSGNSGGIIDIPDGALPDKNDQEEDVEQSVTEGIEVEEIVDGITLKLASNLDINVVADFNGTLVSDLLTQTLQDLFTDLDLSSLTGNTELVTLNYDNKNFGVFFDDMYSKIIEPLLQKQLGSILSALVNIVNVKESIVHALVNRFLPLPEFDELIVDVSLTQGKLSEVNAVATKTGDTHGFGIYLFNRNAQDVISWQGQDNQVYYNKSFGINPADLFVTQAKRQTSGHSKNDFYQNITWKINNSVISDWSVLNSYDDGEYDVVGTAFGSSMTVKLTIDSREIDHIEDITLLAMRDVPDYVTAVFADGSKQVLYNQTINYQRGAYNSEEGFKVLPANIVIGTNQYDFNIILENETITADTVVVNAFNYKDVFADMAANKLKVKVNNSFYRYLDAEYDFSQFDTMTREQLIAGGEYEVLATVGKGSDIEQTLTIKVKFTPFEVYGIEINGKNYVDTDIYDYIAGKSFPETVTVVGFDGEKEVRYTAKATWDTTNVVMDKKGGQYIASVTLNAGEYNEWYIPAVGVVVNDSDLAGLVNDTIVIDTMYAFYGGVTFDRLVPDYLDFYTTNGEIKQRVPVTIDTSSITPDIKGGSYECKVTVGEGDYKFETTVNVVLADATMTLVDKEISFTYEEYIATNGSVLDYRMPVMLGDKQVMAKVTWFTDNVVFDTPGTYVAYVIIDEGGEYEQTCEIKVNILASEEV